jgi:uncharacterized alkaline shock family protein YloU
LAKKNETTSKRQLGSVNISPDAIGMVAGIAALQCFGVVGMASRTIQDGISELLTGKDNLTKGIEVVIDDERVLVDLYIIVEYGVQIKEVARNVIDTVQYAIQNQFALQVAKVNVIVRGVRIEKK